MANTSKYFFLAGLAALSLTITACRGSRSDCSDVSVIGETYVHKYGVTVPSDFWTSSGEHGTVISTQTDGVVISRTYASGTLDGDTSYTYPHSSQIQKIESYQVGILVKETEFSFDGTPKLQITYNAPSPGLRTVGTWYLTGTPKSMECYSGNELVKGDYFTTLNQRDASVENSQGTRLVRDDYGQLLYTDTVEDGQMITRLTYHQNGSPKEIIPYQDHLIHGAKRTFHPAGEPDCVEQWVSGQQEGVSIIYKHGEKYAEVPYVNGEKHGMECRYREGKVVVQEVSWNSGSLHGPMCTYVGDTVKTDWYYRGKPVSKVDYDFMTNRSSVR